VRWSAGLDAAEGSDEVAGPDDPLWVQSGGFLFAFDAAGTRTVRTAVAAQSSVVPVAGGLAVVGDLGGDETALVLTWLSATGEHLRRSPVPLGEGKLLLFDDVALVAAGELLVAGLERRIVAFGG
jgi:hypothetical protein